MIQSLKVFVAIALLIQGLNCFAGDPQAADEQADAECAFFSASLLGTPPESSLYNVFLAFAAEACTRKRYDATCLENICF